MCLYVGCDKHAIMEVTSQRSKKSDKRHKTFTKKELQEFLIPEQNSQIVRRIHIHHQVIQNRL